MHTALIYVHTIAAALAFGTGCIVLRPSTHRSTAFYLYLSALWTMILSLIGVVTFDWPSLPRSTQVVYGLLVLLALYTGIRGCQASGWLSRQRSDWRRTYIGHVGFTLISLFDGFVIVGALDLHAPGWLIATVGVLGIVVGIRVIQRVSRFYGKTENAAPTDNLFGT